MPVITEKLISNFMKVKKMTFRSNPSLMIGGGKSNINIDAKI